ncbi:MAG TPA: pitrilysin family protein [Saprospiraceae bacterium]|nr:pitrilysin family protein [Saprospiraceae bacterium]HMQ82382.1 pitrilysin family protein [Saprospiraceae bacterium]
MLDRSMAPAFRQVGKLQLPKNIHQKVLSCGIPLTEVNLGTQDVVRLEVVFTVGRAQERKKLAARSCLSMMREGTPSRTSAEIAETLDFYGATLGTSFNLDHSSFVLYSLTKHFDKVLPILADILAHPVFPEKELNTLVKRSKKRLKIDLTKNDVVAYRTITELIFGTQHPYGYNSFPEMYDALTRDDLMEHYERLFHAGNCQVFLSGKITDDLFSLIDDALSQAIRPGLKVEQPLIVHSEEAPGKRKIVLEDKSQTAIRIGRQLFNRHHADYLNMNVLNTLFGGYFGSRLMGNIREEKGYTYNIYSTLDPMLLDGCWYIGTEVGNEFVNDTLKQIYHEMAVIREELVDAEELEMVKNYMIGGYLTMLDGSFNVSDVVKVQILDNLPMTYFEEMVEHTRNVTPEELRETAQKYFLEEDMWEVVVGI